MTILDEIIAHKRNEVAERQEEVSAADLQRYPLFSRDTVSLSESLRNSDSSIIAEFKRRSPSEESINLYAQPEAITQGYAAAGASALSILTDVEYFGGDNEDLTEARAVNRLPILRKDFIVNPYQILEAKAIGADAILLIASCLNKVPLQNLADFAVKLGLEVLCEVHSAEEIEKVPHNTSVVGVNNRNLKTFTTSIDQSLQLQDLLPSEMVQISESGIKSPDDVLKLKAEGYQGFLIGTLFMKQPDPAQACAEFIKALKR